MDNNEIKRTVADNIRLERLRNRFTQEELAEKSEISFKYLNMIEKYKANPSITIVIRICRALGVDLNTIYPLN